MLATLSLPWAKSHSPHDVAELAIVQFKGLAGCLRFPVSLSAERKSLPTLAAHLQTVRMMRVSTPSRHS
jgi:hypothetical protein